MGNRRSNEKPSRKNMKEEILNLKNKIKEYIDNIGLKYIKGKPIVQ